MKIHVKVLNLSVFASFLLGACSVGPDFKKPELPLAQSLTRDSQLGMATDGNVDEIDAMWWKAYGSPQINALVEMALKNNPTIATGEANLRLAQANVRAQQGYFFPSIGANYNVTRQNTGVAVQPSVNGVSPDTPYTLNTAGLTVGFVPDIWGGNRRQVESLKAIGNATSYQLEALKTTVANNVAAAAIQEASLREQVKAVRELAEASRRQLEHARRLRAAGYSSSVDLAVQESLYAQAIAQVPTLEKSREQTLDLLAILCGKMPSEQLLLPNIEDIKLPSKLPKTLPAKMLTQRPDVKIAEEYVRAANAQIGAAIANLLPQFSIVGGVGNATAIVADLADSVGRIWSIGGNAGLTLFDGGTLLARKRGADAATDAAVGQYQSTVLGAYQNVADTLYALQADKNYYQIALANERANKTIYDQSDRQLKVGYISEANMLMTQQSYLQSRINSLQAYSVYLGDTVSLYQALGGGWSHPSSEIYHQD